jgi:phage baseplate assembly protein gpV
MAHGAMSFPLRAPSATAIEFDDGTMLLFDRAERGYLVTQTWALRLLDRADGRSTVQRLACEGNVPTPSAIEFFRAPSSQGC